MELATPLKTQCWDFLSWNPTRKSSWTSTSKTSKSAQLNSNKLTSKRSQGLRKRPRSLLKSTNQPQWDLLKSFFSTCIRVDLMGPLEFQALKWVRSLSHLKTELQVPTRGPKHQQALNLCRTKERRDHRLPARGIRKWLRPSKMVWITNPESSCRATLWAENPLKRTVTKLKDRACLANLAVESRIWELKWWERVETEMTHRLGLVSHS